MLENNAREGTHPLARAELAVPIRYVHDLTLRAKVLDRCGLACTFCHNEGTPVTSDHDATAGTPFLVGPGRSDRVAIYTATNRVGFLADEMLPDDEFVRALTLLREACGLDELHLTGGEPTLHRHLDGIVATARRAGYRVGITSNGENGARALPGAAAAGLEKVNFSIFGMTPDELAQVQGGKYANPRLAAAKITALKAALDAATAHGLKVSANIVVVGRAHVERAARLIDEYGHKLHVRLLNSLDDEESMVAIWELLESLGAEPVERIHALGVSGSKVTYRLPDGRTVSFKQIRQVYLPDTCATCPLSPSNDGGCQEGFYGLRLYKAVGGGYQVGVCIQRMDLTLPVEQFIEHPLCAEVLRLRSENLQF